MDHDFQTGSVEATEATPPVVPSTDLSVELLPSQPTVPIPVEAKLVESVLIPPANSTPVDPTDLYDQLTEPQQLVIGMLAKGKSHAEAGLAAKICRMTLYRWRNNDENFKLVYNYVIKQARREHRDRFRLLAARANEVLSRALDKDDAQTARFILKNAGMLDDSL